MTDGTPTPQTTTSAPAPAASAPRPCSLSLIKGDQRWNFRWEPGGEALLINSVAALARDPNIAFDWFDAAVVCKHIAQPLRSSGTSCASSQPKDEN